MPWADVARITAMSAGLRLDASASNPAAEEHPMAQQPVETLYEYPWQSIVLVEVTYPSGIIGHGTGVMVGPNDVLTASHVLYDPVEGGAATDVLVIPAFNPATDSDPFGAVEGEAWHYFTDFDPNGDGNISGGDDGPGLGHGELDVAFIDLDVGLGYETGWMELDPDFTGGVVNLTGYPAIHGFTMMNDTGLAWDDPVDWFMSIENLEAHPGNSGGPVWYESGGTGHVVGIVSTAVAAVDIAGTYDTITGWIEANDTLLAAA
jgi:V8-like Glu-specific endopeptidase